MTIELLCGVANGLWMAGCLREAARFRRATTQVTAEQASVLRRLLHTQADTDFGRQHGFASIRTAREYQEQVPLRSYDDFQPWIDRSAAGEANVLTREPVRLFEPTSGSTGGNKLVPYTASLQREFQRGIRPWIADVLRHRPELMWGQAYWSISPITATSERTAAGIPIGFADDASYVGGWQEWLTRTVLTVPPGVRHAADVSAFRYQTLLALVRSTSLRLISVWHPSFLTLMVERLPECSDALLRDVQHEKRSADRLRVALRESTASGRHATLWPRLAFISCWTDAHAAGPAVHLASLFPQAQLQGKGLIATEAFISFPLTGHDGSALAVRSHFLEFVPVDSDGTLTNARPLLAHELDENQQYSVIVSTGGGLYRYLLHDIVEVVGRINQCPLIRFVGRHSQITDWFGEKLHEAYVGRVLREAFDQYGVSPRFAMLACDPSAPMPMYVLYVEASQDDDLLCRIGEQVDAALRCSFHYDYARRVGQLGPLQVFRAHDAEAAYMDAALQRGRRAGSVKPTALDRGGEWSRAFKGRFVSSVSV